MFREFKDQNYVLLWSVAKFKLHMITVANGNTMNNIIITDKNHPLRSKLHHGHVASYMFIIIPWWNSHTQEMIEIV